MPQPFSSSLLRASSRTRRMLFGAAGTFQTLTCHSERHRRIPPYLPPAPLSTSHNDQRFFTAFRMTVRALFFPEIMRAQAFSRMRRTLLGLARTFHSLTCHSERQRRIPPYSPPAPLSTSHNDQRFFTAFRMTVCNRQNRASQISDAAPVVFGGIRGGASPGTRGGCASQSRTTL
jgi:hypothetical protein